MKLKNQRPGPKRAVEPEREKINCNTYGNGVYWTEYVNLVFSTTSIVFFFEILFFASVNI
jgi:hypothetical protein